VRKFAALFDACVLYPAPLRDLLLRAAATGLFRARWTDAIHEEWIRSLRKRRPDLTRRQLVRTRELMDAHAPECKVEGYEWRIPALQLPDPDDRHVLAAAIHAGAAVIVTFNLRDFPIECTGPHGIEAQHPDVFLRHLLDLSPSAVCAAVQSQRRALQRPSADVDRFLETLRRVGLRETVRFLDGHREDI